MEDLTLSSLVEQAYLKGVEDARNTTDRQTVNKKQLIRDMFPHMDPRTVEQKFLFKDDFPIASDEGTRLYYKPAVHEWLMKHQETLN